MRSMCRLMGVALLAVLCLLGWIRGPAQAETKWNYHTIHSKGTTALEEARTALQELQESTNGQFKATIYERSALGFKSQDIWNVIGKGLVPFGEMYAGPVSGKYPWIQVLELPFLYDINDLELTDYLVDHLWDDYARELAKDNLVLLTFTVWPAGRGLQLTKPLGDDPKNILKGMKIRIYGKVTAWGTKMLGGTPVMMAWAEVFEAGHRGIIDGVDMIAAPATMNMKFYEVFNHIALTDVKTYTQFQYSAINVMVVANKDMFDKLPKDVRAKLKARFRKVGSNFIRPAKRLIAESAREVVVKHGSKPTLVKPETLEYLKSKAPKFWEKWRAKAGPLGNKLLDKTLALIAEYKKQK